MSDDLNSPSPENAAPAVETPEAENPTSGTSGEAQSEAHHTEGTPVAQGNPTVDAAQKKFLDMLQGRISDLETMSLVALELKLKGSLAAADSYGALWQLQTRRAFNIVTRIKRRMR